MRCATCGPIGRVWQPAPARHEAGSPNVIGAIALAEACDRLAALPAGALAAHEEALRERLVTGLSAIDGVEVARIWPDSEAPVGVVTFTVPDLDPGLVAAYLPPSTASACATAGSARTRSWRTSARRRRLRASVGVGTTTEAVDRLIAALRAYLATGPAARYEVVDGCWAVVDDTPPAARGARPGPPGRHGAAACGPALDD